MDEVIRHKKWIQWLIIAFILCFMPRYVGGYVVSIFNFILLTTMIALGLGLLMGYAGQVSLGHNAFYGLGAYTSGILSFRIGISPWLGILCGMVLTGGVAYLIGKPILKLRGNILVIATFTVGLIFFYLFGEMDFLTGGYQGFSLIPRLSVGKFVFNKELDFYYLFLAVLIVLYFLAFNFSKTKLGRECRAIDFTNGGSEVAAMALGINVGRLKNQIFVLSAVFASLSGGLYAHYITHVDPGPFSIWSAIKFLLIVVVGGANSIWGPLIGTTFYFGLSEIINVIMSGLGFTSAGVHGYEVVIFSAIFVAVLLSFPNGLAGLPSRLRR